MNINTDIRKAYTAALQTICPVFFMNPPIDVNYNAYILLQGISSRDNTDKNNIDFITTVQVKICTLENISNTGERADLIANAIYNKIKPTPQYNLILENSYLYQTNIVSDNIVSQVSKGDTIFQDRIITFKHYICKQ